MVPYWITHNISNAEEHWELIFVLWTKNIIFITTHTSIIQLENNDKLVSYQAGSENIRLLFGILYVTYHHIKG
jgi:hypothetical protein